MFQILGDDWPIKPSWKTMVYVYMYTPISIIYWVSARCPTLNSNFFLLKARSLHARMVYLLFMNI